MGATIVNITIERIALGSVGSDVDALQRAVAAAVHDRLARATADIGALPPSSIARASQAVGAEVAVRRDQLAALASRMR